MTTLRHWRERRMLSQMELAGRLGVRQKTISDWERGLARPRPSHQRQLCAVLNIPPDALIEALTMQAGDHRADGATR